MAFTYDELPGVYTFSNPYHSPRLIVALGGGWYKETRWNNEDKRWAFQSIWYQEQINEALDSGMIHAVSTSNPAVEHEG